MRQNVSYMNILIALIFLILACPVISAQDVVIARTARGGYFEQDNSHNRNVTTYFAGDTRRVPCFPCRNDVRNFFVFDLSGVTQQITSARLALFSPGPSINGPGGYDSNDPSEHYELHDVVTPISALRDGSAGIAAWNDLGTGVVYGSRTMTVADNGTIVEIILNPSAIAALQAANGLIAIGGSVTTLDDALNNEMVFGYTGTGTGQEITELRLTLVPEPSTLFLLAIGAISLLGRRRAR